MKKDHVVSVRMTGETKAALDQAAKADDRPVAQYLDRVITGHLRKEGWLKDK